VSVQNGMAYMKKGDLPPAAQMPTLPYAYAPDAPAAPPHGVGVPAPDAASPWHVLPRSEAGEKRYEAVSSQVAGLGSAEHSHRVFVIIGPERRVAWGKTDNVLNHEHKVSVLGTTEEADGHTHTFAAYPE